MCKKVLVHHIHHCFRLPHYLNDFPESKIISTTRDPRANFVSSVLHWRQFTGVKKASVINNSFQKIQRDVIVGRDYKSNEHAAVRLEHMGDKKTLMKLAAWLGIEYNVSMKISTFGGLVWHGDKLSQGKRSGIGFSKELAFNEWEKILPRKDKYIFNLLMYNRLKSYDYPCKKVGLFGKIFAPLIIILPLKFERDLFTYNHIRSKIKEGKFLEEIKENLKSYFIRVKLCFELYFDIIKNRKFTVKLIDQY
jgi:hypothetical protein